MTSDGGEGEQQSKEVVEEEVVEEEVVEEEVSEPEFEYSNSSYKVGTDIPAGDYYLQTIDSNSGYYEVSSDSSGELSSIVTNGNITTFTFVSVTEGQYLKLENMGAIPASEVPSLSPTDGVYLDGTYRVGEDIPAGEYLIEVQEGETSGYYQVSSDVSGTIYSKVTNGNLGDISGTNTTYITLTDGQYLTLEGTKIDTN